MTPFNVEIKDHIAVLTMTGPENRFNPDMIQAFHTALDTVEHDTHATARRHGRSLLFFLDL